MDHGMTSYSGFDIELTALHTYMMINLDPEILWRVFKLNRADNDYSFTKLLV